MEQLPFLRELLVVAVVGVLAALVVRVLRLPAVAGLLLAGAVAGPYGLGWVHDVHIIEALAEVGVIFLLFTIGLEFSLTRLRRIARLLAIAGSLQVCLTIFAVVGAMAAVGASWQRGLFFGFIAALSSTAIVLRGLAERRELDAPHGRLIVGTLIFQDLCVVPMMLVIPVLGGSAGGNPLLAIALALGKAGLLVALTLLAAPTVVPRLFNRVAETRSREVFLLAVLVVCIGTALLTSLAGLSLALGAFLAGVLLADSDFGNRALADMLPLRDLFTSLFFVSLGMLFDARMLVEHPAASAVVFGFLFFAKGILATVSLLPLRPPLRVAILAGVGLAQFGEFGYVLARAGLAEGLLDSEEVRVLLTGGVLTMFITPVAIRLAPGLAAGASRLRALSRLLGATDISSGDAEHGQIEGHVVVGGFGVAGEVLCTALRASGIPYLVLELNSDRVRSARAAGEPIYYGDISSEEALEHAHLAEARALVLLINDPEAARHTIQAARRVAPKTPVFLRTHYLTDGPGLAQLGAFDVVSDEVESGVEMLARVLRHLGLPRNLVVERLRDARVATQASAREPTLPRPRLVTVSDLDRFKVETFLVRAGAHAAGQSAASLRLRSETGALVVALRRDGTVTDIPPAEEIFREGDLL